MACMEVLIDKLYRHWWKIDERRSKKIEDYAERTYKVRLRIAAIPQCPVLLRQRKKIVSVKVECLRDLTRKYIRNENNFDCVSLG